MHLTSLVQALLLTPTTAAAVIPDMGYTAQGRCVDPLLQQGQQVVIQATGISKKNAHMRNTYTKHATSSRTSLLASGKSAALKLNTIKLQAPSWKVFI